MDPAQPSLLGLDGTTEQPRCHKFGSGDGLVTTRPPPPPGTDAPTGSQYNAVPARRSGPSR